MLAFEPREARRLMNVGTYTFIIDIPPNFERDVLGGRSPAVQVNIDATAMVQAGLGAGYIQQILTTEVSDFVTRSEGTFQSRAQGIPVSPVTLAVRIATIPTSPRPGLRASWGSLAT